jgi:hypothetical protein
LTGHRIAFRSSLRKVGSQLLCELLIAFACNGEFELRWTGSGALQLALWHGGRRTQRASQVAGELHRQLRGFDGINGRPGGAIRRGVFERCWASQ